MTKPLIAASNIRKTFDRRAASVLNDISIEVFPSTSVAITGPSGSGKTTLLSIIGGLMAPDAGEIIFRVSVDRQQTTLSQAERSSFFGFVFQHAHLVPTLTALENVELPLIGAGIPRPDREARALELVERFGLGHVSQRQPIALSGGECQRVAVARAFALNPKVILADEPTGNLDRHTGDTVLAALMEMANEDSRALVIVTHDLEITARVDCVYSLRDGDLQRLNMSNEAV